MRPRLWWQLVVFRGDGERRWHGLNGLVGGEGLIALDLVRGPFFKKLVDENPERLNPGVKNRGKRQQRGSMRTGGKGRGGNGERAR